METSEKISLSIMFIIIFLLNLGNINYNLIMTETEKNKVIENKKEMCKYKIEDKISFYDKFNNIKKAIIINKYENNFRCRYTYGNYQFETLLGEGSVSGNKIIKKEL